MDENGSLEDQFSLLALGGHVHFHDYGRKSKPPSPQSQPFFTYFFLGGGETVEVETLGTLTIWPRVEGIFVFQ